MVYSSTLNELSVFLQISSQIQSHSSYFVKIQAWIPQISNIRWFVALILENFTWAQIYFTQVPLVPLVTNSMSEADWRRLVKAFIRQPAHFPVYEDPRAADAVDDMDLSS